MKQIIVNADDFGRHELINNAVAQAAECGFLRSATLMPGGQAFDNAVSVAKAHSVLGIGIHFTLVNGFPILPPEEIPSLVNKNGLFLSDYGAFVKKYCRGKISLAEVRAELAAQLNKMERAQIKITHADSHQHLHHLPGINDIVINLITAANIRRLRIARTHGEVKAAHSPGFGQLVGRWGLNALAVITARKADKKGLSYPSNFAGIVAGEAVNEHYMRQFITEMKEGATEIMLHPGLDNEVLARDCAWQHDFEAEFKAVTSPDLIALLREREIAVANFSDL